MTARPFILARHEDPSGISDLLTLKEAAATCGVNVSLLMLRINSGRLPSTRAGRKHLVRLVDVEAAIAWATCDEPDCDSRARGKSGGLCAKHSARKLRTGTTELRARPSGAGIPNWRGDQPTYKPAHSRVVRAKGKAKEYACVQCGGPAQDWAYNHKDPAPLVAEDGRLYSSSPEFYIPMCKTCHRRMDVAKRTEAGGWKTHCKWGHEFTEENTRYPSKGGRACRTCAREYQRSVARRRSQRTECDRGHAMTEENTLHGRDGRRMCRTCHAGVLAARGVAS